MVVPASLKNSSSDGKMKGERAKVLRSEKVLGLNFVSTVN